MYCSNCGKKHEDKFNVCKNCGYKNKISHQGQNLSLIIALIACLFFYLPQISIPLAIISIITSNLYYSPISKILGILSIISSLSYNFFQTTVIFNSQTDNWTEKIIDSTELEEFYKNYNFKEENFNIKNKSFFIDDSSIIYFYNNNSYTWYNNIQNQNDNFIIGNYEYYTKEEAIKYIVDNLQRFNITEEDIKKYLEINNLSIKDYYLIILTPTKKIVSNQETIIDTKIYYHGIFNQNHQELSLTNIETKEEIKLVLNNIINNNYI